jgi:23S rRNA (cytosine1962-C5)-methyltransferase
LEGGVAFLVNGLAPCVLFEDEQMLVVNKPPGLNTHAPAPYAGEGIYDWLRHREPRWGDLATIQRLDKETSGVLIFTKTPMANRSIGEQFARRTVRKKYVLLTDRPVGEVELRVRSMLVRVGDRYVSRAGSAGVQAETFFKVIGEDSGRIIVEAVPLTGRTHQIRVHAAERGFPILGDTAYGGRPAGRVCLHAAEVGLRHPATGGEITFAAPADFELDPSLSIREALINTEFTNAYRLIHGEPDGSAGWYLDRFGEYLLSSSADGSLGERGRAEAGRLIKRYGLRGLYHKRLWQQSSQMSAAESAPQLVAGAAAPEPLVIAENGLRFELSFSEGASIGFFADQRENRRRLLINHVAAGFPLFIEGANKAEVLNTFAHTCSFSVCAAAAGARVTSLDLSKKYLEWGRRNFRLNGLDPDQHDFIYGDSIGWMRRLARKGRAFDLVILDPPTFSRSKEHGTFRVEKDFGKLVEVALVVLRPGGALLASTNAASLDPEFFIGRVEQAISAVGRRIRRQHYFPQPPDYRISRRQPGYLKTLWMRIE